MNKASHINTEMSNCLSLQEPTLRSTKDDVLDDERNDEPDDDQIQVEDQFEGKDCMEDHMDATKRQSQKFNMTTSSESLDFGRKECKSFFQAELERLGGGGRYLVAKTFYKGDRNVEGLEEDDMDICLQMTLLVHSLSTRQNKLLANFLDLLLSKVDTIKHANTKKNLMDRKSYRCPNCKCPKCVDQKVSDVVEIPNLPPLPRTFERIRSVILCGASSFIHLVAHPEIRKIGNHAFVLPSECIRHFLGSGHLPMEFNSVIQADSYQSSKDTPRGVEIAKILSSTPGIQGMDHVRHLPLSFVEWKDDCEPSKSNKASKFGSLWVWTMTIMMGEKKKDSPSATFPIAIGPKTANHNALERIIGNDLLKMTTERIPAFLGGTFHRHPEEITFSAQMFVSLGDQPERRGGNRLMNGNSNSHVRWRYVGHLQKVEKHLPACLDCLNEMRKADTNQEEVPIYMYSKCTNCTNWMMGDLHHPLLCYTPPPTFPKGELLGGETTTSTTNRNLHPAVLTYEGLKIIVEKAHTKVVNGKWSPAQSTCFLRENGIRADYLKLIVNRAKDCKAYRVAQENADKDITTYEILEKDRKKYPTKYAMARIPSVWNRGLPLEIFIDTPMHLLFLGIAKSIFGKISDWSLACGRKKEFNNLAFGLLKDLESLKLQWLTFNVKTFDSWGGWASEKFQSLSRVALWIYGPLMEVDDVPPFLEPEDRAVENWLVDQYRKWLKAVGKDSTGCQSELKARVLHYKSLPLDQQPQFLPKACGSAKGVLQVLRTMVMMLTTVLQPAVEGEKHSRILSVRVRLFLSAVAEFEAPLRMMKKAEKKRRVFSKERKGNGRRKTGEIEVEPEDEGDWDGEGGDDGYNRESKAHEDRDNDGSKEDGREAKNKDDEPLWLARSNFLCLLNLPETIEHFGSPRNYFEGKYLGERYVQEVKNCRSRCAHQNLMVNLLRKLHQGKALESMAITQSKVLKTYRSTEAPSESNKKRIDLRGNIHVYANKAAAVEAFHSYKPICVLEATTCGYGMLFYEKAANMGGIKYLKLDRSEVDGLSVHHGLRYWVWRLTDIVYGFDEWETRDFAVLLPRTDKGEWTTEYTMVTKEWSPAMLDHYEYSKVGIATKKEVNEERMMESL